MNTTSYQYEKKKFNTKKNMDIVEDILVAILIFN